MSLGTTTVAGSVSVAFPCMLIVLVVVVSVGSILIGVCTLILLLSLVGVLAYIWNVSVQATGHHGFQRWALVCYLHNLGIDLLVCLRCDVLESNGVPITLAILAIGCYHWCYEKVYVTILSCVDYEQGVRCWSWPVVSDCAHHE